MCCIVIGLLTVGFLSGIGSAENAKPVQKSLPVIHQKGYTIHPPIKINSDSEFDAQFPSRIISGYDINGSTDHCCIYIGNCSKPFTIKNCFIHNPDGSTNKGLYIYNSINSNITNNEFIDCTTGIMIESSHNNNINSNKCFNNTLGIYLLSANNNSVHNDTTLNNYDYGILIANSNNNVLTNNICNLNSDGIGIANSNNNIFMNNIVSANRYMGTIIQSSKYNTFFNNSLHKCGFMFDGDNIIFFNSHQIETNNTINNRTMYYIINKNHINIPNGAGQVIIANSTYIDVVNQNLSDSSVSIEIAYSNNCTIKNNDCKRAEHTGIQIWESCNNMIDNNNCSDSNYGICCLRSSGNNIITNNTCLFNYYGIDIEYSNYNNITNNLCSYNENKGAFIYCSNMNIISDNNCSYNKDTGIHLYGSNNNSVNNNTCSFNMKNGITLFNVKYNHVIYNKLDNNSWYGVCVDYTIYNHISHNTFINNNVGGKQGADSNNINFWNTTGSPHGYGNYWSDWVSPDNNSDGIVDFVYWLGNGAGDHYPLTIPSPPVPESPPPALIALLLVILPIVLVFKRKH